MTSDAERLDWLERITKQSSTGISFDWVPEGEPSGFRFMRRFFIGDAKHDIRAAIDAAITALGLAAALSCAALPATADEWHGHGGYHGGNGWHGGHNNGGWWPGVALGLGALALGGAYYAAPPVYYPPPPVYYAPPQQYYAPPTYYQQQPQYYAPPPGYYTHGYYGR